MSGHGGARPGAGRKPRALRYAAEAARAEKMLVAAVPRAIECLVGAIGRGDTAAAKYVIDRLLGRPREQTQPMTEDMRTPTDHPRLHEGWGLQEREQAVNHWLELHRRAGQLSPSERLVAVAVELAQRLALESARVHDPGQAQQLLAARDAREAEMRRIAAELPREHWDEALAAFEDAHVAKFTPPTRRTESTPPSKMHEVPVLAQGDAEKL